SLNLNMMDRDVAVAPMLAAFPAPGIYPVDLSGSGWPANYYFTQQTAAFQYEDAGNVVKNIVAVTNVIWDDNPMPPPNNFSAVQDDIIKEINIAIYCEDQNPNTDPFATPILFWSYYPNDYMVTPECLLLQGHNPLGYKIQDQIVEFSVGVTGRFHAVLHDGVCQPTAVQYSANAVCTTEYVAAGEIQVTGSGGSHIWVEAGHSGNTQYLHGPVGWGGSAAQTASDLADAINNFNTSPNYTAEVNGTTVSIYVSKNVGEDPTVYDLLTSGTIASSVVSPFSHCAPETLADVVATCGGTPTDTYSRECPYGFVKVTPFNYPKYDFTVTAPDHKALFVDDFKDFVNDALTEIAIHRTITPNPLFTFPTLPNYNCGPVEVV
ncbi:MAG: hypothetical protein AAGB22_14650, partial [Bacteroidota bacterium]